MLYTACTVLIQNHIRGYKHLANIGKTDSTNTCVCGSGSGKKMNAAKHCIIYTIFV